MTVLLPRKKGMEYLAEGTFRVLAVKTSSFPLLKVASFVAAVGGVLPELARENMFDLVHFTFDYPSIPPVLGGVRVPVLATVHHLHIAEALGAMRGGRGVISGLPVACRDFLFSLMELALVRQADAVVAVSVFTQRSLGDYLKVRPERTRVVRNGARLEDLYRARDTGKARLMFVLGDSPFLLYVGRLERSKGLERLLGALPLVKKRAPSCRLVVVGSGRGSYPGKLRMRAAELGVEESVTFTGRIDRKDLCELYAASVALVLPSLMEGFGIALIEAMAAGKPCVASRVGAVPEVVEDGSTGLLVPPGDEEALAEAALRVITSPDAGAAMGKKGREAAASRFSLERMVRETAAVYAELAGERASSPAA